MIAIPRKLDQRPMRSVASPAGTRRLPFSGKPGRRATSAIPGKPDRRQMRYTECRKFSKWAMQSISTCQLYRAKHRNTMTEPHCYALLHLFS